MTKSVSNVSLGQVWSYKGAEGYSDLLILHSESLESGLVYHISIRGIKTNERYQDIEHVPISSEALLSSIVTLKQTIESVTVPIEGYRIWKDAFLKGSAGVYKIQVSSIVDLILEQLN